MKHAVVVHDNGWVNGSTRGTGAALFECAKAIPFKYLEFYLNSLSK